MARNYPTLEDVIGGTPMVRLQRLPGDEIARRGNVILGKLEGNNPAGSVKDRPAISMIRRAEERGEIKPGDTLIEATSGNTGIALAMAAAIRGYRMVLIMPEDLSIERAQTMKAFGAELILTPRSGGMEYARDLAEQMQKDGKGRVLDQFANADNPRVHVETTGPEIWRDTGGEVTHFVSAMGTTGTITGVSRFLKAQNPAVRIVGAQPQVARGLPAQDLRPEERGRAGAGGAGRRRRHGAPPGARRGPVRRHLGRRRLLGGAADCAPGGERHHRVRGLRPRRPLPLDRGVPCMSAHAFRFCPACATPLEPIELMEDGGPKLRNRCPACGWTHWNNPTPVLAAVIECTDRDNQILLARNVAWPGRAFALITGFMEAGESPEHGITREVAEETSLQVDALNLIGVYEFTRMNQVIIAYHAQARGEIRLSPELAEYKLMVPEQVLCWRAGTGYALADFLRSRGHEPRFAEWPGRAKPDAEA
jgi:cysteine synthase B